ncbi:hypothetical protein [Flavobacterium psychrophilum]|uniref:hypothetical protein n=1 Tax=Flavobacterium psychrophilum TaxID=96345 RepID=UPI001D09461F|nr:hypothetical protein [Flavobacterium psychrophilum]MCB6099368.1 hypothetical protein [Flavobacterium psychrophilum]
MNTYKLSNIPLKTMLWFLEHNGLKQINIEGGYAKYTRADLLRPIIIQTHYLCCSRVYSLTNTKTFRLQ